MTKNQRHRQERDYATRLLLSLGVDLYEPQNYDCRATGRRYSVCLGRVTCVWHDDHFKKIPFGTFKVIG